MIALAMVVCHEVGERVLKRQPDDLEKYRETTSRIQADL
jgi:hypothetical protein